MTLFNLIVHRLHFLSKIPFAPHVFDAWLLAWTALCHPRVLEAIETFQQQALALPGMRPSRHRYGGLGFISNDREIAHIHSNGLLDIHLDRETATQVIQFDFALPHHVFGTSAWISFWLQSKNEIPKALRLLDLAMRLSTNRVQPSLRD